MAFRITAIVGEAVLQHEICEDGRTSKFSPK